MKTEGIKNIAITVLCAVMTFATIEGIVKISRFIDNLEKRFDALYGVVVASEQRNRDAVDATLRASAMLEHTIMHVNNDVIPGVARMLKEHEILASTLNAQVNKIGDQTQETIAHLKNEVDSVGGAATMGIAQVNQIVAERDKDLQLMMTGANLTLLGTAETTKNLAEASAELTSAMKNVKDTTAHAPEIAASVNKIFKEQSKWSKLLLILRMASLVR
jgi:hypothetical protein